MCLLADYNTYIAVYLCIVVQLIKHALSLHPLVFA